MTNVFGNVFGKSGWHLGAAEISDLIGKTITSIERQEDDALRFVTDEGPVYVMFHDQDCCETVEIDEIIGDLDDLVGSPIVEAEEATSDENPKDSGYKPESFTWTFYKIGSGKGFVTIRWYGESNGYYSEAVNFRRYDIGWKEQANAHRPS